MNVIEQIEQEQIERLAAEGGTPSFAPGDTVRVNVKVVEGTRERIQAFATCQFAPDRSAR